MRAYCIQCKPLIRKVLEGYNAVLIAYGQTGSGKTHTLLGKAEQNVKGVLPLSLESFLESETVTEINVSGCEAYGTHVSRIELYDLFADSNASQDWTRKSGASQMEPKKTQKVAVKTMQDCWDTINTAHSASHFAPTGKNPESSRGHAAFVAQIKQNIGGNTLTSYFVVVDLAGSEGESAFTADFVRYLLYTARSVLHVVSLHLPCNDANDCICACVCLRVCLCVCVGKWTLRL